MTKVIIRSVIATLLLVALSGTAGAQDVQRATAAAAASIGEGENPTPAPQNDSFCCTKKYFLPAALNVLALELIPNYFNWNVSDDTTAVLSTTSWSRNIRRGFEWDPNNLATNMFAHPYHGNVYFNAGRSNGYNFWESQLFAYAGSFLWEMFGENNQGAINDWAMTSLGGITIGEALHRTAIMVRDNQGRGVGRAFRELGGFLLDPVGGFNRAWRGEMSKYGANREDRFPLRYSSWIMLGARTIAEGRLDNPADATAFFEFHARYGDPMLDHDRPFDSFTLNLQLNAQDKTPIGVFQVHGTLFDQVWKQSEKAKHVLTIDQLFDYADNSTYEIGDMAFAVALRSRWTLCDDLQLHLLVQPNLMVVSAILSEYAGLTGRSYDFGSGFGLRLFGAFTSPHFEGQLGYRGFFTSTLNGAPGNQIVHFVSARAMWRMWRAVGMNVDYTIYMRDSFYQQYPDVHRRNPELRVGVKFFFGDRMW